jgi:hypothetical protein
MTAPTAVLSQLRGGACRREQPRTRRGQREKYHFSYADGTPFYEIGTTCYAWAHQPAELQEQTLRTLAAGPFNKIRFCVFPKHYDYNLYEPVSYPYEGTPVRYRGNGPGQF